MTECTATNTKSNIGRVEFNFQFCILLFILGFIYSNSSAQCTNPPQLSFNQCSNAPLSFDSYDSTLTCANWYINKIEVDSFSSRINLGTFGSTLGTNSGLTLVNEDSNWYGFYNNNSPINFYRLNFGSSLNNTPSVSPILVNNISSATNLTDGSLDIINYNGEWLGFSCTRSPASVVRYKFGTSLASDTISADLMTGISAQIGLPLDVELIKKDGTYYLFVVGTTNRFGIYSLGANPSLNPPTNIQTITTSALSPSLTDPRGIVSRTICDTTFVFINGRTSNNIIRLLFDSLNLAPFSTDGVATSEPWTGPFSLVLDIEATGPKLYVQQWNSSPALGRIFKLNAGSILNSSSATWSRSEVFIPGGGIFTTTFTLAHDSAKSYIFQSRYGSAGLFMTSTQELNSKQLVFHNQPFFDLVDLDTGLNSVVGEFYTQGGELVISHDTVNAIAAPNDQIQLPNSCLSSTTSVIASDLNGVVQSRFWDFGNGDTLTSIADTVQTTYVSPNPYTIALTSTNGVCISVDTFSIIINHLPTSDFIADTACLGEVVTITNNSSIGGGDSIIQYLWIFNNVDSSFTEDPNYIAIQIGNLDITLICYSSAGCTDTSTFSTFIKDAPSSSFTLNQTCFGDSTNFISTVPQNNGYLIQWDFGDGQTSIDSSPSHLFLDTGLFTTTLTVTATNGCQLQSSTLISISNSPSIDYSILSSICQFEPIEFQSYITTEDSVALVSWQVLDSTYFGQNIGVLLDTFGSINCILEVVVGTDCKVDSSFSILVNEAPLRLFYN